MSQENNEQYGYEARTEAYNAIPKQVLMNLPHLLREPCLRFTDREEQELFLMGALCTISGMLPHYVGNYFGADVGTNLYCFIIGRYGTGKGALRWAQHLGKAVHEYRLETAKEQATQYRRNMMHYKQQMKEYEKGKLEEPPEQPTEPGHLKLFIPGNTTKTAVMQLLKENDGNGIIFETEGDTLADMLRQDYGNFSDILRKAFHHEPVSFFRRANNEDVDVPRPALSVVLSGTHDQLLKLIPSIDNGLFSRFWFYMLEGNSEFRNPFDKNDFNHAHYLEQHAQEYLALYKALQEHGEDVKFFLTERQQERFVTHFAEVKEWTQETISEDMDGSVNRMAVMCYRVAMILTILRDYRLTKKIQPAGLICDDTDLESAITIIDRFGHYTNDVYEYLQQHGLKRAATTDKETGDAERNLAYRLAQQQGMSLRKISLEVFGDERKFMRVKRILDDYGIKLNKD